MNVEEGHAAKRPLLLGLSLLFPLALLILSLLLSFESALGSTELLTNAGFEEGTTDHWTGFPDVTLAVTDFAHSGAWAASLYKEGLPGETIYIRQDVAVVAGAAYSLTGRVYHNDNNYDEVCLRINWLPPSLSLPVDSCTDSIAPYYRPLTIGPGEIPMDAVTARIMGTAKIGSATPQEPVCFDDLSFISDAPPAPSPSPSAPISSYVPLVVKNYPSFAPAPGVGQPTYPLISEILYDGTIAGTEGDEFVELVNPANVTLDLTGYRIGDEETMSGNEGMYYFPAGTIIRVGDALIVAKNAAQFKERFGFDPNLEMRATGGDYQDTLSVPNMVRDTGWSSGSWSLANDGDEVLLLDPLGQVVDAISYEDGDGAAVGVTGRIAAASPLSLQRAGTRDSNDMQMDFLLDDPNPGIPTNLPPPPSVVPPAITLPGGVTAYWGNLRAYTTFSDGSGPPHYAYAVGRANGLHFLGLSDGAYALTQAHWNDLQAQADLATVDGAFVALGGFEWTHPEDGCINVFGTSDYVARGDAMADSLSEFYAWLASQGGAAAQFNRPDGCDGVFDDFAYDSGADGKINLLEMGDGAEASYLQSLYSGWKLGPAHNAGTETPDWGADTPHRTGVVAPGLSERDLMAALEARRTFATEDANLAVALRVAQVWMGSTISATEETNFTVHVGDLDGEGVTLELYDRALVVGRHHFDQAFSQTWGVTVPTSQGHFYFVRAVQDDGDQAYTSPLWMEGMAAPDQVLLNEIMPVPQDTDWDGDGVADSDDEWVELYNASGVHVGLAGWLLDDIADGGSTAYRIPWGTVIAPHEFLVLFKRDTGLALNNDGDTVRLLRADGSLADSFTYDSSPGADRSFSRSRDGAGEWTSECPVTMGGPNCPREDEEEPHAAAPPPSPTSTPSPAVAVTIAQARELARGTKVVVQGQVTAPPNIFHARLMYVQDEEAGILVYLEDGEYPSLHEGDWVQLLGETEDYHGERELTVARAGDVQFLREDQPLAPLPIRTGEVGEETEGLLAQIEGSIVGWERYALHLDDGSGPARVYIREATGIERPWVEEREVWRVVGIVSQYAHEAPYEGGYRLLPRYDSDISRVTLSAHSPEQREPASPPLSTTVAALIHLGIAYLFLPALF